MVVTSAFSSVRWEICVFLGIGFLGLRGSRFCSRKLGSMKWLGRERNGGRNPGVVFDEFEIWHMRDGNV